MKFLVCIVAALLAIALAGPTREKRSNPGNNAKKLLEGIQQLKNPATYAEVKDLTEVLKPLTMLGKKGDLTAEEQKEMDETIKVVSRVEAGVKILYELAKATLVEGAKPTEQELTDLAKRLSAVVRESRLSVRNYPDENTLMTNETIDVLKQIAEENEVKESGNTFLDIFKEKLPKIYPGAKGLKMLHTNLLAAMKAGNLAGMKKVPAPEKKVMGKIFREFLADETIAMLKSEEAAVEIIKNYGIIIDTLKTASSYDSLQAVYNSLKRSKRLESYAILVREAGKCIGKSLSPEEKAQFHEHMGKFLQVMKLLFADGQDTSNVEGAVREFEKTSGHSMTTLAMKMSKAIMSPEGKRQLRQCLVSDKDRQVFKEIMALSKPVFSDSEVEEFRQKNEKVYALVNLLNGVVTVVRSRTGLGDKAEAFLKEMVTMPNSMLRVSEFFATQETLEKIAAHKKMVMAKYKALPGDAKKEFVNMFPYRTVFNLALLD